MFKSWKNARAAPPDHSLTSSRLLPDSHSVRIKFWGTTTTTTSTTAATTGTDTITTAAVASSCYLSCFRYCCRCCCSYHRLIRLGRATHARKRLVLINYHLTAVFESCFSRTRPSNVGINQTFVIRQAFLTALQIACLVAD